MKKPDELKKPFFEQFLEHQLDEKKRLQVQGSGTLKYPSDKDEEISHTLKYPSDRDEI